MQTGILVAGSIIVDNILEVEKYPISGELTKIVSISKATGGLVPNVAIALKKLDKNIPVFACGKIADDENGNFVLKQLKKENVDISNITYCEDKTSFSEVVSVVGGQRTFFAYPGACDLFNKSDINFKKVNAKYLHLGYFLLLKNIDSGDGIKILQEAKKNNIITSIDLVSENSNRYSQIIPCLKYVDNLIINEIEASRLTNIDFNESNAKDILQKLKSYGVIDLVVIHKKEGSYMLRHNSFYKEDSVNVPMNLIKGTTGAGDAFVAGILYGLYNNYEDDELLKFAAKVAASSLFSSETSSSILSVEELKNYK